MVSETNFELSGSRADILVMTFITGNQIYDMFTSACEGFSYGVGAVSGATSEGRSRLGIVLAKIAFSCFYMLNSLGSHIWEKGYQAF